MSLKVEQYVDLGTHGMFICSVTEARVVSDQETMSYTYYQKNENQNQRQKARKALYVKSADISTKATNFRKITSAHCANMAQWISSRLGDVKENNGNDRKQAV